MFSTTAYWRCAGLCRRVAHHPRRYSAGPTIPEPVHLEKSSNGEDDLAQHLASLTWFPGHMAKAIRIMKAQMRTVNCLVEVRDARLPASSRNHIFEELIKARRDNALKRIIIYNKCDLALSTKDKAAFAQFKRDWRQATREDGREDPVLFTTAHDTKTIALILERIRGFAEAQPAHQDYMKVLVIGMPNVGKSTILNGLRQVGVQKGNAARTGALAGVTRSIPNMVKILETPPVYIVDSPGVMVTGGDISRDTRLKIALTGGIKDNMADDGRKKDAKRQRNVGSVADALQSTLNVTEYVDTIGRQKGFLLPGGIVDTERTMLWLLRRFREGKFGTFVLDQVHSEEHST